MNLHKKHKTEIIYSQKKFSNYSSSKFSASELKPSSKSHIDAYTQSESKTLATMNSFEKDTLIHSYRQVINQLHKQIEIQNQTIEELKQTISFLQKQLKNHKVHNDYEQAFLLCYNRIPYNARKKLLVKSILLGRKMSALHTNSQRSVFGRERRQDLEG